MLKSNTYLTKNKKINPESSGTSQMIFCYVILFLSRFYPYMTVQIFKDMRFSKLHS